MTLRPISSPVTTWNKVELTPGLDSLSRSRESCVWRSHLPQRAQAGQHPAGVGQFVVREVVRRELLLVKQFTHLVIEALGAVRFDECAEIHES